MKGVTAAYPSVAAMSSRWTLEFDKQVACNFESDFVEHVLERDALGLQPTIERPSMHREQLRKVVARVPVFQHQPPQSAIDLLHEVRRAGAARGLLAAVMHFWIGVGNRTREVARRKPQDAALGVEPGHDLEEGTVLGDVVWLSREGGAPRTASRSVPHSSVMMFMAVASAASYNCAAPATTG